MNTLRIALIQTSLHWEDPGKNLGMFDRHISKIDKDRDLILLPEMFTTGFTMNASQLAEEMDGTAVQWMKDTAISRRTAVAGSLIIREQKNYFNRMVWVCPDGQVEYYDKRHLFRLANEQDHYTPGNVRKCVEYKGWKICLTVCYDLRFPVWSRNRNDYDILINVANWPIPRIGIWDILLKARAIENIVYVIAVNRVGEDGNGMPYSGHSAVVRFDGGVMTSNEGDETILTAELDKPSLEAYRKKFPFYIDADDFSIVE